MSEKFKYDCRWSESTDEKFINDFVSVENAVFNCGYTKELFDKKFKKNIFGSSVTVVVYLEDKPVAARALWRNDVNDKEAYQPCDTCVLSDCRGMGVFTQMTKKAVEFIGRDVILYNFPNANSRPGYLKMGWHIGSVYSPALLKSVSSYKAEHPVMMDDEYADWWLNRNENYVFIRKKNECFLLRSMNKPKCYLVVSIVSEATAKHYPEINNGIVFYRSSKKTWYNKSLPDLFIVTTADNDAYIPTWKMDVI